MNRGLFAAAAIFLVATVLGFVVNVPIVAWVCLAIGAVLLVSGFLGANPTTQSMGTTQFGAATDPTDVSIDENLVGQEARPMGTPTPANLGAPVNAGPPHIPESREDPYDNNGTLGIR